MTFAPFAPKCGREPKASVRISEPIFRSLRTGIRADIQGFRQEFHSDIQNLQTDIRADSAHIRGNLAGLRKDIQALTVRMARIQVSLVGYFTARGPLDSHDNA